MKKAARTGADKLIKSITYHKNGKIRGVTSHDALKALEVIGRYYKLWERGEREIDDPEAVLAFLLGWDKKQLPPRDDPVDYYDGEAELLEESNNQPAVSEIQSSQNR